MNKKRVSNIASTAFLVAGGVFALQVLISNVSAVTNRINMSDEKETNYINGIMDQANTEDEADALFVGDLCIFSESGYFDNAVGESGFFDQNSEKVRISCDGVVSGVSFDKSTRTLTLDGYTGNEKILFFNTKKTAKDDFNIKVYGENKVKGIDFYEYVEGDKPVNVNISGGGTLNGGVGVQANWSNSLAGYNVVLNVENVVMNGTVVSSGALNINNSKISSDDPYNGISVYYSSAFTVKNSDIDVKKTYLYSDSISIENSDFKSTIEPINVSDGKIKIKNSNLKIENTKSIPTRPESRTPLPEMFIKSWSSPFPFVAYKDTGYGMGAGLLPDLIEIEEVDAIDGGKNSLKIVTEQVVYNNDLGAQGYIVSVFGTDETRYNGETEMWENFPQAVTITAKKPELVGAKITKEEKNKDSNGDNGEKKNIRPVEKDILEGENQEMNIKDIKDLVIRYNRSYVAFNGVAFDGKMLTEENFTVESGSTIVTIKADFLKTQKAGEHTVSAYFIGDDKPIETTFTIKVKSSNTGLFTNEASEASANFGGLFALSAVIMVAVGASLKIREKSKKLDDRYF